MFGDFTGVDICNFLSHPNAIGIAFAGLSFSGFVTTTTTTEAHGLHGKVFATSSATTKSLVEVSIGGSGGSNAFIKCFT
jgi:hypothetical protein